MVTQKHRRSSGALALLLAVACMGLGAEQAPAVSLPPEFLTQFGDGGEGETSRPRGVATDPNTGHVLVADGANRRVSEFTAWGFFVKTWGWGVIASGPGDKPSNERQQVSVDATAGSFRLRVWDLIEEEKVTSPIPFDATAATVQSALAGLSTIDAGNVLVSGPAGGPWTVEFVGAMADKDLVQMVPTESTLSGGAASVEVETLQHGANFEICVPADGDVCQAGQSGARFGSTTGLVGQFAFSAGLAVDANGDVYVADPDNLRVQKFDSEGNFLLMIGGGVNQGPLHPGNLCTAANIAEGDVCGPGSPGPGSGEFGGQSPSPAITVGPDDVLYVGDKERIQKFNPDGSFDSQFSLPAPIDKGTAFLLAVAPSGNLFVSAVGPYYEEPNILQLNPAGVPICTIEVGRPTALAADSEGNAYFFAANVYEDPEEHTSREMRVYDDSCEPLATFGFDDFGSGYSGGPRGIGINALGDVYVSGDDEVNRDDGGVVDFIRAYGPGPVAFEPPPPAAPEVVSAWASAVGTEAATVQAQVNPRFWPDATYYVEYGKEDCDLAACAATAPLALTDKSINQPLTGAPLQFANLEPGTTYHYRVVAESGGGGPTVGTDHTFRTHEPAAPGLPDERVYELVSPLDKGGAEVGVPFAAGGASNFTVEPKQASPNGGAVTYTSFTAFGEDPQSAPAASQYLSRRSAGGQWSTQNLTPPFEGGFTRDPIVGFSTDLSHAAAIVLEPPLTEDAAQEFPEIYWRDNAGASLTALTTAAHEPQIPGLKTDYCLYYGGASADSARVVFAAGGAILPGDPVGRNLYEWSAEEGLALASVLPDGSPAPPTGIGTNFGAAGTGFLIKCDTSFELMRHAVSADGSKVFWTYGGTYEGTKAPLFARVNGTETIQLDKPNEGISVKGGEGVYWDASLDGSKVFFTVAKKLTATPTASGSVDLYRYDFAAPEGERLTDLSAKTGEGADVQGVVGASADGSYVYFAAKGVLDPAPNGEGEVAQPGKANLYLWHEGEGVSFIAKADGSNWSADPSRQSARVAPDGRHLAFVSTQSLTGYDNEIAPGENCGNVAPRCPEVFLYDHDDGSLRCASCSPSGAKPLGPSSVAGWSTPYEQPRYLSDDGGRVFFETLDVLDPHDSDGKRDVYQFERAGSGDCTAQSPTYSLTEDGCVQLVSTGQSSDESYFVDASASGDDVFISTREGLVPADQDTRYDVYDARVGGAPPVPPVPPCEGEACRGPASSGSAPQAAGTAAFQGPGDPAPKRGCPKGRREVRKGGKARCVKPKRPGRKHSKPKRRSQRSQG